MQEWPKYRECTPEQRRALWAIDQRERRSERRWRELVVLFEPATLCDLVGSDHKITIDLDCGEGGDQ